MTANVETMAYVKRTEADIPWHKLGTAVPAGITGAEMIEAAGLNWTVGLAKMFMLPRDGAAPVLVPNARAIVRCSDKRVFGTATDTYTLLQNADVASAMDGWVKDGRFNWSTAGALGNGSRVWFLGELGERFRVGGRDEIARYVLVSTGHDGATAATIKPVATRVVCANTMTAAMAEKTFTAIRLRHTMSINDRMKAGGEALGLVDVEFAAMRERFEMLAQLPAGDDTLARIGEIVFPMPAKATDAQRRHVSADRLGLWNVYQKSPTVDRGTAWGVFNAVTEYQDHYESRRGQDEDSTNADHLERRALYSLEGAGADVRDRVMAELLPA